MHQCPERTVLTHCYIYSDGASRGNPGPAGSGAVILDNKRRVLRDCYHFLGKDTENGGGQRLTNNVAEYEGILLGLRTLLEMFRVDGSTGGVGRFPMGTAKHKVARVPCFVELPQSSEELSVEMFMVRLFTVLRDGGYIYAHS